MISLRKLGPMPAHRRSQLRLAGPLSLLLGLAANLPAATTHPLAPLTSNELVQAHVILIREGRITTNTLVPIIALEEPAKELVLEWRPDARMARVARVTAYDLDTHRTHVGLVDLQQQRTIDWRARPGVMPLESGAEFELSSSILSTNPLWIAALKRRGFNDPSGVSSAGIPGALVPFQGAADFRLLRVIPFLRHTNRMTWMPVEGLSAVIDLTRRRVLEVSDRFLVPRSTSPIDFYDPAVRGRREGLKPLLTTQPDGVSFTVQDRAVAWDCWRFRYSFNAREGLVLHQVAWQEPGGRLRPILYRASVSDLLVAYADPDENWSWRAFFDEADFGFGYNTVPLLRGMTTVAHASLFAESLPDQRGGARELAGAVDLYERDAGTLWSHSDADSKLDAGPRARELVIGTLATVGNYDYRFQWSFRQDGSIEFHVYLTGIMQLKGTDATRCAACADPDRAGTTHTPGEQGHGVLVADRLLAPHHQHFFNLRLDFDIDGVRNSVKEYNLVPGRKGRGNPHGNAFSMTQTVFAREREAVRDFNPASHRMWAVFNPSSISALGHPAAYLLEPGMNTVPFLAKDSSARQRAGFTDHHWFVTRHKPSELFAAGEFPITSAAPDNVLSWTRDNEGIQNTDIVAWYTLGVTHVARPEEYPVMPTAHASVRLVPKGFFERNPALDVPDNPTAGR